MAANKLKYNTEDNKGKSFAYYLLSLVAGGRILIESIQKVKYIIF